MPETLIYRALDRRVLVVAVINDNVGDWNAYIGAVPGIKHDHEYAEVAKTGSKLPLPIARLIFPEATSLYKWRD